MSNLTSIKKPPSDLSAQLRNLADEIDSGRVSNFVAGYVLDDTYTFMYGSSIHNSIVMIALLQNHCIAKVNL